MPQGFQVPSVFTAVDKFTRPVRKMEGATRDFGSSSVVAMNRTERATRQVTSSVGGLLSEIFSLKNAIVGGAIGVAAVAVFNLQQRIEGARREAALFSGATGEALDNISARAMTTADIFDKDVNEVLASTNAFAKGMGISFEEAGEKLNTAFVAGADRQGELLEIVKEYPGLIKQAGISADAFLGIINTSADLGIFSDKGIDVIKEADIRLRELPKATQDALTGLGLSSTKIQQELRSGATTTFEVMQQVSARLSELPKNSAVVGTAIADIFGGPGEDAGIEYLRLLKDIDGTQGGLASSLSPFQKSQLSLTQSTQKLNLVYNQLFGEADNGFTTLKASALSVVADGLENIVPVVKEIITETRAWVSENEGLIQSQIVGFINGIAAAVKFAVDNFSTIVTVTKLFAGTVAALVAIQVTAIAVNRTMAATLAVIRAATFAYNIVLGVTNALQGKSIFLNRANVVALRAQLIATKAITIAQVAWNGVMTAFNAIVSLNPIGLIIIGVVALIALVTVIVKKWETWGAAVSLLLGPLGFVISLIQSLRRNWDLITDAFQTGGIVAGLKMIGATIVDAVLMPVQQLLELVSNVPGFAFAEGLAAGLERFRATTLGVNVERPTDAVPPDPDAPEAVPAINTAADQEQLRVEREERITQSRLDINVNDPQRQLDVNQEGEPLDVNLSPTFNFSQ